MMTPPPLLLLSDVDGTLLGDDGALPCPPVVLRARLRALAAAWGAPVHVGLASSRTLRELTVLQRALGVYGPLIAEDGALRAVETPRRPPARQLPPEADQIVQHGRRMLVTYQHADSAVTLREKMADQPAFARADTATREFRHLQGLGFRTRGAVRRALLARSHSVLLDPSVWSNPELEELRAMTAARGLQLRRGGRWFTLTTAGGKGPALRALRHQFSADGVPPLVAAIGNEENDHSLLADADRRYVIRNPHRGPHPVLSAIPGVIVCDAEGPGGWMNMLDDLMGMATATRGAHA
jgi:mannosyl-3-phosphoglycerate phosphatase